MPARFNKLSAMTDANGHTTQYQYNSSGDLLGTTYADGSNSSHTFIPKARRSRSSTRTARRSATTYNAAGQITHETFSDGSSYAYAYEQSGETAHGQPTEPERRRLRMIRLLQLLTTVAYPTGMFLTFSYNAAGQRSQ